MGEVGCSISEIGYEGTILLQKLKNQADELRSQLSKHGWEVAEIEQPFEDEWWAAEFWLIESVWSPQGARVYLTFLVDPIGEGRDIWAVHASEERPQYRPVDDNPLMSLRHGWKKELRDFIESLHRFRTESPRE